MEKKDLTFVKSAKGNFVAEFDSCEGTIQIERGEAGSISVHSFIEGFSPVPQFSGNCPEDYMFHINFPAGLRVQIVSTTPVEKAAIIVEGEE